MKQRVQKLVTQRVIEQPYQASNDEFHTEAAFVELSRHLQISPEDYESVLMAFQYARLT